MEWSRPFLTLGTVQCLIALVALAFVLRLALSAAIPLSIDESYAVVVSRSHSLSYFDHPPIGFALARLMADLGGSEQRMLVRFPFIVLGTLSTVLLFDLTRLAYGRGAAFWAAAWFTVAPFFFISAGHFVVPDGPLDFFLLASAWCLWPVLFGGSHDRPGAAPELRWTGAGIALALALMSKYQAVLFAMSIVLILLGSSKGRRRLGTPWPWIAAAIAGIGLIPIVLWNAGHDWSSIKFQTGRPASVDGGLFHLDNLAITLIGQAAYLWPVVWCAAMAGIVRVLMNRRRSPEDAFFAILAIIPILLFDLIALFSSSSLPHWSMSGFLFAFPLVGRWTAGLAARRPMTARIYFGIGVILTPLLAFGFALQTDMAAFSRLSGAGPSKLDLNWQLVDWSALAEAQLLSDGGATPARYVVAPDWMQGAKVAAALGPDVPVKIFPGDPHHFQYMAGGPTEDGAEGLFIGALDAGEESSQEAAYRDGLAARFRIVGPARRLEQSVAGFPVFQIVVLPVVERGKGR